MTSEATASQLIMTWKSAGGLEAQDLRALKKMITSALNEAVSAERQLWLRAMDDKEAAEHVVTSIRTRFPEVGSVSQRTECSLIEAPKRYPKRSR